MASVLRVKNPVFGQVGAIDENIQENQENENKENLRYKPMRSLSEEEYLIKLILYVTKRTTIPLTTHFLSPQSPGILGEMPISEIEGNRTSIQSP